MLHHGAYQAPGGAVYIKDVWAAFFARLAARLDADIALYGPVTTSPTKRFQFGELRQDDRLELRTRTGEGSRDVLGRFRHELAELDAALLFLPALRSLAAARIARLSSTPFVVYSGLGASDWDDAGAGRREALYGIFERSAVKHARGAIAAGAEIERRFATWVPTFRTAPITGVVSASTPAQGDKRPEVVYVGSLSRRKGVPELLEAWRNTAPEGWRLTIVGPGDLEDEVRAFASERQDVEYLGYVPHGPALFELYRRAAILVLPSRNEGFPRVLLEAAAHGCALAASRVGGVPAAFDADGYQPRWVQPGDAGSLAAALNALAAQNAWQAEGVLARAWFDDNFGDRDRALEAAAFLVTSMPELLR